MFLLIPTASVYSLSDSLIMLRLHIHDLNFIWIKLVAFDRLNDVVYSLFYVTNSSIVEQSHSQIYLPVLKVTLMFAKL